jgi:hypothetical protein
MVPDRNKKRDICPTWLLATNLGLNIIRLLVAVLRH